MATAEQKARADTYRVAATEHLSAASDLYDLERYALGSYVAGLSVECILRAYRYMIDPEFDSRHELKQLYRLARFADVVPAGRVEPLTAALELVVALWSNDYRFLSEEALRKLWAKRRLYEGVKGDFVKERARELVNAAGVIVSTGAARWKILFKS